MATQRRMTGTVAHVFFDNGHGSVLTTGSTVANRKYFIMDKGPNSNLPLSAGMIFQSPLTGIQITLTTGDRVYLIDETRVCKTSASFEFSDDAVDAGDDCHPSASIRSGVVSFSGSLEGLFMYDPVSSDFEDATWEILNKYCTMVEDTGSGSYTLTPRDENQSYLICELNSGREPGQTVNYLFAPIIFTSASLALALGDPQNKSISFQLGEGEPVFYQVPTA